MDASAAAASGVAFLAFINQRAKWKRGKEWHGTRSFMLTGSGGDGLWSVGSGRFSSGSKLGFLFSFPSIHFSLDFPSWVLSFRRDFLVAFPGELRGFFFLKYFGTVH